jgi:hypothetical protein
MLVEKEASSFTQILSHFTAHPSLHFFLSLAMFA